MSGGISNDVPAQSNWINVTLSGYAGMSRIISLGFFDEASLCVNTPFEQWFALDSLGSTLNCDLLLSQIESYMNFIEVSNFLKSMI